MISGQFYIGVSGNQYRSITSKKFILALDFKEIQLNLTILRLKPEEKDWTILIFMKMKKEMKFFSPEMKMSDLVEINYRLLTVLSRLGMHAGFGEKTVAQVCKESGIDAEAFILICNIYSYQGYMPTEEALKAGDPLSVLRYLQTSHSFYIDDGFSTLERLMDKLVAPCAESQQRVILDFLEGYRREVEKHFEYEETVFFPYVESVAAGSDAGDYSASTFEENHSNIEEKLSDLKNIVMKYLPAECNPKLANDVLFALFSLSEDLERHTNLENHVLVPMVNRLEVKKEDR